MHFNNKCRNHRLLVNDLIVQMNSNNKCRHNRLFTEGYCLIVQTKDYNICCNYRLLTNVYGFILHILHMHSYKTCRNHTVYQTLWLNYNSAHEGNKTVAKIPLCADTTGQLYYIKIKQLTY